MDIINESSDRTWALVAGPCKSDTRALQQERLMQICSTHAAFNIEAASTHLGCLTATLTAKSLGPCELRWLCRLLQDALHLHDAGTTRMMKLQHSFRISGKLTGNLTAGTLVS
eukprot:1477766-Amphidinium_carterae.1